MTIELTKEEAETIIEAMEGLDVWLNDERPDDLTMHTKMWMLRARLIREFQITQ
jgi:hypothetical protein